MCAFVYTLTYVCTHTCTHLYLRMHSRIYTYTHVHTYMLTHVHAHMQPWGGTQYFRSPFTEAVERVLISPCWLSVRWQQFLMSL